MRPTAYVHCRLHTDTSRIHMTANLIVVDVGLFQSMALLKLPITADPSRTEAEWLKSELARLCDEEQFERAIGDGLVEFRVADRATGARYTRQDVLHQLALTSGLRGGISKFPRGHPQTAALRAS